jgi:hypothetical protein
MDVQYSGFGVGDDQAVFFEAQKRHAYVIEPLFTAVLQPLFHSLHRIADILLPSLCRFDGVERIFQLSIKLLPLGIELLTIAKLTQPSLPYPSEVEML